jgi:hypothetical protein
MKLLFVTLFLVSLSVLQTIQEADLSIPISITFNNPPYPVYQVNPLFVGIDSIATDSIDTILGEANLPPVPPPGFAYLLFLPYNNFSGVLTSFSDYRYGTLPFTGTIEYRIRFWEGATIHWELPAGITGLLQDFFGGVIVNQPISGIDSFYVSTPGITGLRLFLTINNYIPVELNSFTAIPLDNSVNLNWLTATETNNSGFQIDRSKKLEARNDDWINIDFVIGNGTTTEPQFYSFVDEKLSSGIYKYRLKQIDFDGNYEYSNEIEVDVDITPKEFILHQNYPNPFNPSTNIQYSIGTRQFVQLKVYDVWGNEIATLVNEEKPSGLYNIKFTMTNLPAGRQGFSSGIYFYKLQAGGFVQTKKMILMK